MRMTSGIQFAGYPESFCIQLRSSSVSRGAMPSMDAPGRSRPMTRSHAETDWCSSDVAAGDQRLLLHGNPQVGRIAPQRFAKESRRCDADDGERVALHDEGRAHDRRIAAVRALPGMVTEHRDRRGERAGRRLASARARQKRPRRTSKSNCR